MENWKKIVTFIQSLFVILFLLKVKLIYYIYLLLIEILYFINILKKFYF